jgi:predicted transglutaminase-like cysteine proteinase
VLIVRTSQDDIVLDNLTVALLSKQDMPYRMVRMQAADDLNKWVA